MTKTALLASLLFAACSTEDHSTAGPRPLISDLCDPSACPELELLAPNYTCTDGSIAGPACVENESSPGCHWELLECGGAACTEAECGPAPGAPNYVCSDGTIAGPACLEVAGNCGWQILDCAAPPPDCISPDGEPPQDCDPGTAACECDDPQPGAPNYLCQDGQHVAGPACTTDATGTCGWQILDCP